MKDRILPLEASKIQPVDASKVNGSAFYKVAIQVGGMNPWRTYSGKKRVEARRPTGESFDPGYEPTVFRVKESITGEELKGLIGEHNLWLKKYQARVPNSEVDYQLVVLEYEETTEVPPELSKVNSQGMIQAAFINQYVDRLVTEKLAAANLGKA